MRATEERCGLVAGPEIAAYGFGDGHPFGPDRHDAFMGELRKSPAWNGLKPIEVRQASRTDLLTFHTEEYVDRVVAASESGSGVFLDQGDTPSFAGVYDVACFVVGATVAATEAVLAGQVRHGFVPIAGLHHAARNTAAGFCVFNDCAIAMEIARQKHGLGRVAYVDIDAHHGDGVYYGFEDDPGIVFADLHEDGRYLYPGTGERSERGIGDAEGYKLNVPLPPNATDDHFMEAWQEVEAHLKAHPPELIMLQCGADSLRGDPITHMAFTESAHGHAARRLCELSDELGARGVVGTGGGGYNRDNLARAWTRVVESLSAL